MLSYFIARNEAKNQTRPSCFGLNEFDWMGKNGLKVARIIGRKLSNDQPFKLIINQSMFIPPS
jgi:hypothetical protein